MLQRLSDWKEHVPLLAVWLQSCFVA